MKPTRAEPFHPKLIEALKDYNLKRFSGDLLAGVTVGLVALPLAMAFAISSGVPPQSGIYCAIVAGFLVSALGGSRVQIAGPTGAFVVVVAGIVQKHGIDGLYMCTMMAGVLLVLLGVSGLGTAVKFIPRPVVIGFTNGIAVLIASTQVKDFFGLDIPKVPGEFAQRVQSFAQHWSTLDVTTTVFSFSCLLLILLTVKFAKKVPGAIVAMVVGTVAAAVLHLPLETIATRFGGVPSGLPHFVPPSFRPELIQPLLGSTVTVAMLGAIESLLSAVVADRMSGDRHNPNVELFAQGIANIATPMVGGLPATGAIARTATNVRSGATSPVSGIIHALTLLCILLFAAPLAKQIPLGALAAILMVVAYNMGEWKEIPEIWRLTKSDKAVWFITFALTIFADLTVAVEAGMILAALLYIQKVTSTTSVSQVTKADIESGFKHSLQTNELPDGVAVFRIHGPFLFGSTDKLDIVTQNVDNLPEVVMLRLRNMTAIDGTGLHALTELAEKLHAQGKSLIVCGMRPQPDLLLRQSEFREKIGQDNVCPSLSKAIVRAKTILAEQGLTDQTG